MQTPLCKNPCFFLSLQSFNMQLHIFNPEHDLALAFGKPNFTPPHAARELRTNMGYLPAFWAEDGDIVLVDDVDYAVKASAPFRRHMAEVLFLSFDDLHRWFQSSPKAVPSVNPWGWDAALCHRLMRAGYPAASLPSDSELQQLRILSSRATSVDMLPFLLQHTGHPCLTGKSYLCASEDSVTELTKTLQYCVLKAPWSSSGRGIRYVESGKLSTSAEGWMKHTLEQQHHMVVEPYYRKLKDFALEFFVNDSGKPAYCGLSLFDTQHGNYTGNLLMQESAKREEMRKYVSDDLFDNLVKGICLFIKTKAPSYRGPFGVDMMVVADDSTDGILVHPCVELNLRRTMGHAALALTPPKGEPSQVMRIVHRVNYQLKCSPIEGDFVKVM